MNGLVMVAFEELRRPNELQNKKKEFEDWITNYPSIPGWPTGARPRFPIHELHREYGPYFSPNYNLLIDVDLQNVAQLKTICELAEAHCHVSGYIPTP